MSANVKKAGRIGTKVVAVFLFLVLVMFNVEVGLYNGESSERSILGLKLSLFTPDALSSGSSIPCWSAAENVPSWYHVNCVTCSNIPGKPYGPVGSCSGSDPGEN